MVKYVNIFEKLRKRTSLSMAFLILIIVLFITFLSNTINTLSLQIDDMAIHEGESVEAFLEQSLNLDDRFLNLWKNDWNTYKNTKSYLTTEELIKSFVDRRLKIFPDVLESSIVLFFRDADEIIYIGYQKLEYERYRELFYDVPVLTSDGVIILNDTETIARFGEGDRVYLSGTILEDTQGKPLYLYVGFHEKIMYNTYINALNLESLYQIKNEIKKILHFSIIFMMGVILYGISLIFLIRWFTLKTILWFAKVHPFGEIAIQKGYLTKRQAQECLEEQSREFNGVTWF